MVKLEPHKIFIMVDLVIIALFGLLIIYAWTEFIFLLIAGATFFLVVKGIERKEERKKKKDKDKAELRVIVQQIEREKK